MHSTRLCEKARDFSEERCFRRSPEFVPSTYFHSVMICHGYLVLLGCYSCVIIRVLLDVQYLLDNDTLNKCDFAY